MKFEFRILVCYYTIQCLLVIHVFVLRCFGHTHLRKIIIKKIVRFTTRKSIICDFRAHSSKNHIHMEKLFSFYAILGLHGTFWNATLRINETALYNLFIITDDSLKRAGKSPDGPESNFLPSLSIVSLQAPLHRMTRPYTLQGRMTC